MLNDFGQFSGNRLPGAPGHFGTIRAMMLPRPGLDATAGLTWATKAYVNDQNRETAGGYGVVSLGTGYTLGRLRRFVRVENVGAVWYTNRVQVNDNGGFFFYPAPGRNASAGGQVRW